MYKMDEDTKYQNSSHLIYNCKYHVIFCPKYRYPIFVNGIDTCLKEIFVNISYKYQFDIIEMEIMPDHVHLLISCNPRFGIMNCIKLLKGISSNQLRLEYPNLKSKCKTLWMRSTFVSTVGTISLDVEKKYIENQKKEKR